MSLQELMLAIIPDASARANYTQLTGIDLGEDAIPIGQLSQSAKTVQSAPAADQTQAPSQTSHMDQSNDFSHSDNSSVW